MPELFDRVKSLPNICGIELAFTGTLLPSAIEGYQEFYNSIPSGTDFKPAHFGRAAVSFDEESQEGEAGISYKQKLVIKFPVSDSQRADRVAKAHKVKFVKIMLANKKELVIGRSDFEQNARMKIKTKLDENMAQVEFESQSIFPSGYVPYLNSGGLPVFFPINFFNTED